MQYQHLTFRFLIIFISFLGIAATATLIFLATSGIATAADNLAGLTGGLPALTSTEFGDGSTSYSLSLQVLALMTALTLLPSLVLGMTSFTRIIIVCQFYDRQWARSRRLPIRCSLQ